MENPTVPPKVSLDDPVYATITDNLIEKYFDKYTDEKCYYRLGIRSQTNGNQIDYTVIRNHHYRVKITQYGRMGNREIITDKLVEPEDEPLHGETYITASFNGVEWTVEDIDGIG
jgi:hypothetical protein